VGVSVGQITKPQADIHIVTSVLSTTITPEPSDGEQNSNKLIQDSSLQMDNEDIEIIEDHDASSVTLLKTMKDLLLCKGLLSKLHY